MAHRKENKAGKDESGEEKSTKKIAKNKTKATKRALREKSDSSDSEDSGDAENVDVKKNKYERTRLAHVLEWDKQFWKLTKPRFGVHQLLLCKECQEFNYKMGKSRFELNGERVHVTQSLCDECVLLNIDMSNTELRHADPNYPDNTYKDSNKDK